MKRILSFLLLFIVFFTKIISGDGAPKPPEPNCDLTIYVEDKKFKIESKNITSFTIVDVINSIGKEIGEITDERFCDDNGCIDEGKKNELKEFKKNLKISSYSLEKFKKDNEDHYFLEFYDKDNPVDDYKNIVIKNFNDIKEIYLTKDNVKSYEIVIENIDIYDKKNVGFKDVVKQMIKTIPFELDKFTHNEILKNVLEQNKINENFVIDGDIDICYNDSKKINEIKLNIKINEGKEDICYKKITFNLNLTVNKVLTEHYDNSDFYYKDWKDKFDKITFKDLEGFFNLIDKDIYLFEKEINKTYDEMNNIYYIELDYSKKIEIKNIIYNETVKEIKKEKNSDGSEKDIEVDKVIENEKLKVESDVVKPITIFTDSNNIDEFLYKLSSLLHLNIYECFTLKDSSDIIIKDGDLSKLSKIEINQNGLKVKYEVEFGGENKNLLFSNECDFKNICRLLVDENSLENYKLTGNNGNYDYYNNKIIPSVKDSQPIKYKLALDEKKDEEKNDPVKNKLPTKKIDINNNTNKQQYRTVDDINDENNKINDKNDKLSKMLEKEKNKESKCCC